MSLACARCGTIAVVRGECLACGYDGTIAVPAVDQPSEINSEETETMKYLDARNLTRGARQDIIKEAREIGVESCAKKRGIRPQLIQRWLERYTAKTALPPAQTPPLPAEELALSPEGPPLPAWREDWAPEVKVKWLEVWYQMWIKSRKASKP